ASVWTETVHAQSDILWEDAATYAQAAQKAFGVPADYTQAGSSTAGIAFQAALQTVNAPPPLSESDREALVKALEKLDIQTFYGRLKFAEEGEFYHANIGLTPLTVQIQNGIVVIVGPEADAEAKLLFPMVPWKER
ncbi:MAG: hypothetical protein PVI27_08895, partial [Desulfobacteraceae bacterium]